MSPSPSTPSSPPVLPSSGNAKYIAVAVLLVIGIAALLAWRACGQTPPATPPVVSMYDAAPTPHDDDLVPPPLPPEQPQPDAGVKYIYVGDPCSVKTCSGKMTDELEQALGFRGKQAHRCYDQALAQDQTLKGHVTIKVRVAANGKVCSANVTNNDMGTPAVANCVAGTFARSGGVPAPKGGCVDAEIPINFIPGGK